MAEWTDCLAIDCEMVAGMLNGRWQNLVARVSIVNEWGQCVYSTYVKPVIGVKNVFRIRNKAPIDSVLQRKLAFGSEYSTVRKHIKSMIEERILVGHAFDKDLKILRLRHPHMDKRDAADFFEDDEYRPSLRELAASKLNMSLKDGPHDSTQAAVACMRLYKLYESAWDEYVEENDEDEGDSSDSF